MSHNNGCPNGENDYERGVREERARIVALLRVQQDRAYGYDARWTELEVAIKKIERGSRA